jgi:hypothetical protein
MNLWACAALGVGLLGTGAVLRRTTRRPAMRRTTRRV